MVNAAPGSRNCCGRKMPRCELQIGIRSPSKRKPSARSLARTSPSPARRHFSRRCIAASRICKSLSTDMSGESHENRASARPLCEAIAREAGRPRPIQRECTQRASATPHSRSRNDARPWAVPASGRSISSPTAPWVARQAGASALASPRLNVSPRARLAGQDRSAYTAVPYTVVPYTVVPAVPHRTDGRTTPPDHARRSPQRRGEAWSVSAMARTVCIACGRSSGTTARPGHGSTPSSRFGLCSAKYLTLSADDPTFRS